MANFIVNFGRTDILILFAMLPSIIIGFIIYKKDVIEKEPFILLVKLILFGVLSAGISLFFEINAEEIFYFTNDPTIINIFFKSFIIIAFCEEFIKWLFTYVICWKQKDFNYTYDAIVYAVFISLGFATIENIIAILSNKGDFLLVIQRGLITVPAHAFFGIICGYYLGTAKKYQNRGWIKKSKKNLLLSIIMPVLVHGTFDCLLFMSNKISFSMAIVFILYLYYSSYVKVSKVSKESKKITKR